MRHLLRPTLILSLFTLSGQALGFVAQLVTASLFGARSDMDAYLAALTLPTYVNAVLFSGLSYVFVPIFVEYRSQQDEARAWDVANSVLSLYLLVAGGLLFVGLILARPLLALTVPGLPAPTLTLAATLARIAWPGAMLAGLLSLLTSLYHAHERFSWAGLVPLLGGLLNLVLVVGLGRIVGVYTLVLAQLASVILQVILLLPIVSRHFSLRLDWQEAGLREILQLLWPLIIGALFAQADTPIERYVASSLAVGSISHLGYATRLATMLAIFLSGGLTVTIFPLMARQAAGQNLVGLRESMSFGLRTTWLLVAPALSLGISLAYPLIALLLQRGAFTAQDTGAVAQLLPWYLLAVIGMTIGNITSRGFYALKDTRTMSSIAVLEVILFALYTPWLGRQFGAVGVAAATTLYWNLSLLIQCGILWVRLGRPPLRRLTLRLLRLTVPALFAGVIAAWFVRITVWPVWLMLMVGLVAGGILYLMGLVILRAEEWRMLSAAAQEWFTKWRRVQAQG